ncbi:MAG TPA: serine/threonine-protein kinase [Thermoanaerobaculia bacterium]|nr:serine/threonine-protein kinase [Thermoanaerobaculia bacterium]
MRKQLGKYLIEAELGRGGMGVVYRAHQPSLERTVAIKLLSSDLIGDPDGVRRFRLEAKSVAKLNHPNIVQVYDIEEEENLIYLVMEFVDGESLDSLISKEVLTESRCLKIVAEIADALHYAHEKGIVHRDVKPANVLMTSEGRVKVADFGLAYLIDREGGTTRTGFLVGSPNYMSPEQAMGQKVDRRSDVYALGVVLFRMLTGRVPFVAESSHAVLFMQVQQEPPDPRDMNKGISLVTRGLVLKALNKKPEARFQTMAELRDAALRQAAALSAGMAGELSLDEGTVALDTSEARASAEKAHVEAHGISMPPVAPERTKATAQIAAPVPPAVAAEPAAPAPPSVVRRGPPRPPARPAAPARSPILPIAVVVAGLLFLGLGGTLLYRSGLIPGLGRPVPTPPLPLPTAVPTPGLPLPTPTAVFPPATPFPQPTVVPTEAPPLPTPRVEPTKPIVVRVPTPRPTARIVVERPASTPAAGGGLCVQMGPTSFAQGKTSGFAPGFDVGSGPQARAAKPDLGRFYIEFEVRPSRPQQGQLVTIEAYFSNEAERDVALDHVEENVGMSVTNFRPVTSPPPPAKVRVGRKEPVWAFQGPLGASFLKTIKVTDGTGDSWSRTLEINPCP